ncbi:hypothetical protein P3T73_04085 [Kiritimatiellota bacterium B12222]|nr:hypothetical protein P3T73_04085 [Kiritimatiellota bacterium B12222]
MTDSDIQIDEAPKVPKSKGGIPAWMVAMVILGFVCYLCVLCMQFMELSSM